MVTRSTGRRDEVIPFDTDWNGRTAPCPFRKRGNRRSLACGTGTEQGVVDLRTCFSQVRRLAEYRLLFLLTIDIC